ncbi:hypothetical protein D3C87_2025410 [compost metagenome]
MWVKRRALPASVLPSALNALSRFLSSFSESRCSVDSMFRVSPSTSNSRLDSVSSNSRFQAE